MLAAELGWLEAAGFGPAIDRCARCGKEPGSRRVIFFPANGGVLCRGCRPDLEGISLAAGDRAALAAVTERLLPLLD